MNTNQINLISFFSALATLIDSTHRQFRGQHLKATYICVRLADALEIPEPDRQNLVLASLIHDIGTLTLNERLAIQSIESSKTAQHCEVAYWILSQEPHMLPIANIIRNHHHRFDASLKNETEPSILSQILHLADRLSCAIDPDQLPILSAPSALEIIKASSGKLFDPALCDLVQNIGKAESFWLDMDTSNVFEALVSRLPSKLFVDINVFEKISLVFRYFIDFRSEFTIAHTAGVAAIAEKLAEKASFSSSEIQKIRIAAYLHDIGKYAVPAEILEKPVTLSAEEFGIVRATPYYTFQCLSGISDPEIQSWAGLHHERINGSGYPFRFSGNDVSKGAQIVGIADMFSAMIERRPYRDGKSPEEALKILKSEAEQGAVRIDLVELVTLNLEEIVASHAQKIDEAFDVYNSYMKTLMYSALK